ncbi:uncharacterized protein LOC122531689 [Frieseomelitta varia]|uniref:uncharacterized protein LOC122531689 n=1 Tax=Frieseomelitta varia TaxID=561572 RepID=UPI001CB6A2A1|nr:uncharacterized protein LOC122531689 [Frieseomelitta varia]
MPYGKLHVLPLSLFILIPVTFLITYTISVQWDHVVPGFPYISETGTLSPESCIFAQFLNIAALLLACCVYIRHRQVSQWQFERGNDLVSKRIVVVTAWCGILSCFGLDILANFQEARVVAAHMIGAMTCFTAGTIYFCLQTYLSRKMVPAVNGRVVVYIRAALSVLTLILTITTILAGYISMLEFQGNDYKKWLPTDGGWGWHVASTISEWLLAIVYCVFLLTFVPEFRLINFEDPVVTLIYLDKDQDTKLSRKLSPQQPQTHTGNMDKEDFLVNLHYLPIILFISLPSVFILTYVIAVLLGHVEAGFPYISDAATYAPESCIFAQFINMIAMLMSFVVYIRYSQVKECSSTFSLQQSLPKWNYWALIFGLTSTFGLSMVANFQETSVIVVHFIGALLCFGGGTAYFWTQAVCSFYLHPLGCSLRLAHLRAALSTFCTVCFVITLITGVLARLAYKGTNPRKWYKEDGGWELHVASTITEWLCAVAFCVYILTFTEEFRDVRVTHPKVVYTLNRTRLSNDALNESQDSAMGHSRDTTTIT